ncbi:MAG TPA: sugar transferase [Chitinophagaceae bacterium]|nr:sugar transferase [Chitinophagaceae bacterium]
MSALNYHKEFPGVPRNNVPNRNAIVRSFVASKKKYLLIKRFFDIVFSSLAILTVLSWLLPVLALLIKAGSKGPVFFKQKRIGLNGKPFICLKFRTMIPNQEADEVQAGKDDCRITRLGGFLRRTNLDELPQFFNVLAGQMSVVGPRPHMVHDCIRFSFVVSSYAFRGLVRPGITGWAQINGYHGPTTDYESIILRYYWDAQYVRKANLWLDIKIICLSCLQGIRNLFEAIARLPRKDKKQMPVISPLKKKHKKTAH